jgi:hypothetical protein
MEHEYLFWSSSSFEASELHRSSKHEHTLVFAWQLVHEKRGSKACSKEYGMGISLMHWWLITAQVSGVQNGSS